jgi:hypothetical protein
METLNVGDRVKLKEDSEYANQSKGTIGTIIDVRSDCDYIYQVRWSNGHLNCYRSVDIELVQKHYSLVDRYIVVYDNEESREAYLQVMEDNAVFDEDGRRFVKAIGLDFEGEILKNRPVSFMIDSNDDDYVSTYGFMTNEKIIWLNHILQKGEYIDFHEFNKSMSEENKLKLECLKRYPKLKIGEKFGFTNYHDSIVKELHPRNWAVNLSANGNYEVFLAKYGESGANVYRKNEWAERTSSITSVSVAHHDDIEFPTNPEIIIPLLNRKSTIKQLKL